MLASHAQSIPATRILHSVGHLVRGGIERWLYEVALRLNPQHFEHHVMVWTADDEPFTQEFRDAGVRIHAFPNYKNPILFCQDFNKLLIEQGPFDILHTHGTQFHAFVLLLARQAGIHVRLAHSHTDIRPVLQRAKPMYRAYAALGHIMIRALATAGLACSESAAISMFGFDWRSNPRLQLLNYGIDLSAFSKPIDCVLRKSLGISPNSFVVGHVGRFEEQKNHHFLVEVIAEACKRSDRAHFLLIGDGSLHETIVEKIERLRLSSRVTFLQDCRDVASYMIGVMDAFAFPSIYEGLGIVAIEAQAAGLPCLLSTDVPPEAAFDMTLAKRLALTDGPAAWAEALLQLPQRIDPLDEKLRERFEQSDFNINRSAELLAATYHELVRKSNRIAASTDARLAGTT